MDDLWTRHLLSMLRSCERVANACLASTMPMGSRCDLLLRSGHLRRLAAIRAAVPRDEFALRSWRANRLGDRQQPETRTRGGFELDARSARCINSPYVETNAPQRMVGEG